MNENIRNRLMDFFIMKDFMACNKWLPIDPRRQAMTEYQIDPAVHSRVNGIVGDILEIIEDDNDSLYSEKN
jgi:hypothetical protein